jgi:hypothetical protein
MSADRVSVVMAVMATNRSALLRSVLTMAAVIGLCAGSLGSTPVWGATSALTTSTVPAASLAAPRGDVSVTTIYRNTLKDGTVEFSDRPAAVGTGAANVGQSTYLLPDAAEALRRAEAEREHWRKQAQAFESRNQQREAQAAAAVTRRAQAASPPARVASYDPELLPRTVYYLQGRPVNRMLVPQIVPGTGDAPAFRASVGSALPFGLPYRPGGLSR